MEKSLAIPPDQRMKPTLPVRRFSLSEYHRLVEVDVLTSQDRVELINGWIVPKVPQNQPHALAIEFLIMWIASALDTNRYSLRVQLPLTLKNDCEPEPDFAVVLAQNERTGGRHPSGDETLLVIEVADSSIAQDRTEKLEMYATNGILEYWIVNLVDREIEVHSRPVAEPTPGYVDRLVFRSPNDAVPFAFGKEANALSCYDLFAATDR